MGILNDTLATGLNSLGVNTSKVVNVPEYVGGDFPDGLVITQIINNKEEEDRDGVPVNLVLRGTFAPHQPWEWGGEQQIVKEYYSGNDLPSVQVLGPRESDIPIKGTLKSKFFKQQDSQNLRLAAEAYQQQLDLLRKRGNLIKIELGEWQRYGYIKQTSFKMRTRADIDYELDFMVISEEKPDFSKFTERSDDDLKAPNKALIDAAASKLSASRTFPTEMTQSVADLLNDQISAVADSIAIVTDFVNGILTDAEQLEAAASRAVGLIRYARSQIATASRRIGAISYSVSNLGATAATEAQKSVASIESLNHIGQTRLTFTSLAQRLAAMQQKFAALAFTLPLERYLVRENDTLQKISIRYYNTTDNWTVIYDHNDLATSELTKGQILEIPRL